MVSTRAKSRKGWATEEETKQSSRTSTGGRHVRFWESAESNLDSTHKPLPRSRIPLDREEEPPLDTNNSMAHAPFDLGAQLANAVNHRLEAARSFFSTQEVSHTWDFESRFEEIDGFLRMLSNKKVSCDVRLYETVKLMADVHRGRIQKASGGLLPYGIKGKEMLISTRLPTTNPVERVHTAMELRRQDRPPFTIKLRKDDPQFFSTLHVNDEIGELLRLNQRKAYMKGIFDTGFAANNAEGADETFDARATDRGRQAAALQIALQSFGGCMVQHFGDQDHQVMDWPRAAIPEPVEPVLSPTDSMQDTLEKLRKRRWDSGNKDKLSKLFSFSLSLSLMRTGGVVMYQNRTTG